MATLDDLKRGFEFIERVREETVKDIFNELGAAISAASAKNITKDEAIKHIEDSISSIAAKYAKEKSIEDVEIKKEEREFSDVENYIESTAREAYMRGQEDEYGQIYDEIYNKGYNEGYARGSNDGYTRGYNDGYSKGYNDGYNKV